MGGFMEKFKLSYLYTKWNYLSDNSWIDISFSDHLVYNGKEIEDDDFDDIEDLFEYVSEIKQIIKKDMERIRDYRISKLENNDAIMVELNILIDTIDNEVSCDCEQGNNFLFLTDHYLCFNNFENEVDAMMLGELGEEAETYETIVIVDRDYKNFYFVRTTRKLLNKTVRTTVSKFSINGNKVISKISESYSKTSESYSKIKFYQYDEEEIKKLLCSLN